MLSDVVINKILIVLKEDKKPSGTVRVWVRTHEDAERALLKNGQEIKSGTVVVK